MLLFLTGPLSYMPNAVLAAVVFLIGVRLVDVKGMSEIYRLRKGEFAVAAITAATVVVVGVEQGIILAIFLSIVEHIYHSYRPYDTLISIAPDRRVKFLPYNSGEQVVPGLVIYRFGASLYYANATRFTAEVLEILDTADPPLEWFCLSASAIGDIDYSGSDAVRAVVEEVHKRGVKFAVTQASDAVRRELDAYGLTELIGAENFFDFVEDVVEVRRSAGSSSSPAAARAPSEPPLA